MKSTLGVLLLTVGAMANAGAWTYKDIPNWEHIVPKTNECKKVGTQSPIDIATASTVNMTVDTNMLKYEGDQTGLWDLDCGKEVEQFMNPHTWEVEFPDGVGKCKREEANLLYPHVTFKAKKYFLKQFHYHAPSEHTVNGKFTDMEAHHVHVATDGQALVIAVNLKVGAENPFMAQFWGGFPTDVTTKAPASKIPGWRKFIPYYPTMEPTSSGATSSWGSFISCVFSYYHYMGSFTTPQCTTNTIWILQKDVLEVSEAQLSAYRTAISAIPADVTQLVVQPAKPPGVSDTWNVQLGVNNRPVQPLGVRKIYSFDQTIDLGHVADLVAKVMQAGFLLLGAILVGSCLLGCCICYVAFVCCCGEKRNRISSGSSSSGSSSSDSD